MARCSLLAVSSRKTPSARCAQSWPPVSVSISRTTSWVWNPVPLIAAVRRWRAARVFRDDRNPGAGQCGHEFVGDIGSHLPIFRSRLDRPKRHRGPVPRRHKQRRHRAERGRQRRLPRQRLRRRLAIAAAIRDREPPEMGKAAAQRHIHDLDARRALQQFAAGAFEPDVAKHRARGLADKAEELALQGSAGSAGDGSEFRQAPIVAEIGTHRVQRAPDTAGHRRRRR